MRTWLLLAGLVIGAPALAVPTPLSAFDLPLPGTTAAAEPVLAGTVVSDTLVPFTISGALAVLSGTVQVRTVRGADKKLAFYWKINNAAGSGGSINSISLSGFPKTGYDANWRKDGLGTVAPSSVTGGVAPNLSWVYGFRFKTAIQPGQSSRFFFLRSAATVSKPSTGRVTGGGAASADLPMLAPG